MRNSFFKKQAPRIPAGIVLLVLASCGGLDKGVDRAADTVILLAEQGPSARSEPLEEPVKVPVRAEPSSPLQITITRAVGMALENNRGLVVERLNPSIQQTFEEEAAAVFDPETGVEITAGREAGERAAASGGATEGYTQDRAEGLLFLEQFFPSGTTVTVEGSGSTTDSTRSTDTFSEARLGVTVNQALLKGYGSRVNLAPLQQARLGTRLSEYELRGLVLSLVGDVERTYWDYALAGRRIEIFEESLKVARQQLDETGQLVAVGRLAEAELPAVQAEVAAREQGLINARSNEETLRLRFLRLLNVPGAGLWQRRIHLIHRPVLPEILLDPVGMHVDRAMGMRPVLNQARLEVLIDDLEVVKTRNGLLPMMDLFLRLGKSGYAETFGAAFGRIAQDDYDALAGIQFRYPVYNRESRARHRRAMLSREQAEEALDNLSQLVEVDIRAAYIEVLRSKKQIGASKATRRFDEEKLRIETEKFRVGKSTSFLVAQAQRDLLVSRIAEVQALTNYLKALVDLYQADGSLLERRGIRAPGRKPVTLSGE